MIRFNFLFSGFPSLTCCFSQEFSYSLSSLIPPTELTKATTNVSSLISLIFIPSDPQDRQMIVFSISLFISPHNLWIIFQHFTTSALSEWIASRFSRVFSRRLPDNKILLVKQIFEHFLLNTLKATSSHQLLQDPLWAGELM